MTEEELCAYRGKGQELARKLWYRIPFLKDLWKKFRTEIPDSDSRWEYYSLSWEHYKTRIHLLETRVKIYRLQESGLQTPERSTPRLIVSMTSHPPRIAQAYAALYTLLTQSLKPDKVVLWLAQSQFPCKTHDLPKELLHLRQFGLSIQWCEDLKSLKKIIPSLRSYPDDVIVTADDDIMYPPYWLEHLYAAHQKNPSYVQARMAYSVPLGTEDEIAAYPGYAGEKEDVLPFSYTPSGWGGVLYPPHSLHEETTHTDIAMKIAPYDDEIWCWAMMVLQGTRLHAIKGDWDDLIRLRIPGSLSLRGRGLNIYVLMLKTYPKIREIFVAEGHTLPEDLFKSVADDGQ